jgi:hypothetical protein
MLNRIYVLLRKLRGAWRNRSLRYYSFVYCDFEGGTSQIRMYVERLYRSSEHHYYLVGILAETEEYCSLRLDRVRGCLTDLRTKKVHKRKSFLFDNALR